MISKVVKEHKNRVCYALAFLLPVLFMIGISAIIGFYPFGKVSVLVADMRYQFVDYYGYLKSVYFGNNDLFYSFSKTFGGDMMGFTCYYLGNPFTLMLLLFPNDILPAGILFMIILLMGLSGFTFNFFINHVFELRWVSLMYSTAYAFMGFFMAYLNCTLYFYNIMLLPLIILGLFRIVEKEKTSYLYIITLFLSIVSNYYMGYMACLFSIIIFIYLLIMKINQFSDIAGEKKAIGYYIADSLTAVGLSAFALSATLYSLKGQKSMNMSSGLFSTARNFNMRDVFSGFYSSAFHGNVSDGLPIIYCGVLTVVFLFYFFANVTISKKEKILAFLSILVMLFSFWFDFLNVIWHGFAHPIGFPYRNSYLFCFLVLFFSYKGFIHINDGIRFRQCIIVFAIFIVYSAYLLWSHNEYVGLDQVVVSGAIVSLTLFLIFGFNYRKDYMIPIVVGLFMIQSLDLVYNGYMSVKSYFPGLEEDAEDYSLKSFSDYVDETSALVDGLNEEDPGFYRIEKLYRRTHNDPMMFAYNGLSHFSSCETEQVKSFMGSMGFRNSELWAFYGESSTALADSLFGVKYLLSQYDETSKPYDLYKEAGDKFVYLNPYALPLCFGAKDTVKNTEYSEEYHFKYQNEIAKSLTGKEYEIYRPVKDTDVSLHNVDKQDSVFSKINPDEEAYIEINFVADSRDFVYMYLNAKQKQKTKIVINDLEKPDYFSDYGWSIREVGKYHDGDDVSLRIYLEQDSIQLDSYELYYENKEELKSWYEDVTALSDCRLDKIKSSHLKGEIDAKEAERIVFSIPYEEDWTIEVDGERVRAERVLNALLSIDITPGKHTIEMKYVPKGFMYGLPISILFVLVFVARVLIDRKKDTFRAKSSTR